MNEKKYTHPLSVAGPLDGTLPFATGMRSHSQFISTRIHSRSDLGECVICTYPPHLVCKVHAFRTASRTPGKPSADRVAEDHEAERLEYLEQRAEAFRLRQEAHNAARSVREHVEASGMVYDEELDEARPIIKATGYNIYLELLGCLDDVDPTTLVWTGRNGILDTMQRMSLFYPSTLEARDRRAMATDPLARQLKDDWHDAPDLSERIPMQRRAGLGHTYVDPSRRPESQHVLIPRERNATREEVAAAKQRKLDRINDAAMGIAPNLD